MGGAPTRHRRQAKFRDVFRSDFIQDSGTPLQWVVAWEIVQERECRQIAETAIKTMIIIKACWAAGIAFAAGWVMGADA